MNADSEKEAIRRFETAQEKLPRLRPQPFADGKNPSARTSLKTALRTSKSAARKRRAQNSRKMAEVARGVKRFGGLT